MKDTSVRVACFDCYDTSRFVYYNIFNYATKKPFLSLRCLWLRRQSYKVMVPFLFIQLDATCGREEDMKKLKDFDLQWEFGPCIGT